MEGFHRIRNDRLSDKAVHQLLQRIRAGELPVGTRLPNEADLANQLGVSRGILREALTILQTQGYISRAPREGTIVRSSSGNDSRNSFAEHMSNCEHKALIEFRVAIECRAIRNVIKLASAVEVESIFQLISTPILSSKHRPDYYFHYRLAELSGNPLFCAFIDLYYDNIYEKSITLINDPILLKSLVDEQLRIAEAIRARDSKKAVAFMRSHLHHMEKNSIIP